MNYLLFTTQTCPKCPEVKQFVANNLSFPGEIISNTQANFMELAQKYEVSTAPTLIIFDNDKEIFRGQEVCEIEDFFQVN